MPDPKPDDQATHGGGRRNAEKGAGSDRAKIDRSGRSIRPNTESGEDQARRDRGKVSPGDETST
jgi:hypothetical protein